MAPAPGRTVVAQGAGAGRPGSWTWPPGGISLPAGILPEGDPPEGFLPGGLPDGRTPRGKFVWPPSWGGLGLPTRGGGPMLPPPVRQASTESFRKDFLGTISLGRQRDSDPPGKSFRKDLAQKKAQRAQKKGPMGPKKGPNGPFQNAPRPLPGRNPSGRIFPSGRILWARPQLTAGCRPPCHPIPRAWAPIPEARPRPGGVGLSWGSCPKALSDQLRRPNGFARSYWGARLLIMNQTAPHCERTNIPLTDLPWPDVTLEGS